MKRFHLIWIVLPLLLNAATYDSLTSHADKNDIEGFKEQIINIPNNPYSNSIVLSYQYAIPYQVTRLYPDTYEEALTLPLSQLDWCTNSMLRFKVYIPKHTEYFSVTFTSYPNNTYLGFMTFRPNVENGINDAEALDKTTLGNSVFYDTLFNQHETVLFKIRNTRQITIDQSFVDTYNVDVSEGGYLYFALAQAPELFSTPYGYRSNASFIIGLYIDITEPYSTDKLEEIITAAMVPTDATEPFETSVTEYTRGCTPSNFAIITESGTSLSAQEQCELTESNVWMDDYCYSEEEYTCVFTESGEWSAIEERCISAAELACTGADVLWYTSGEECLPIYAQSVADASGEVAVLAPFYANAQGWVSDLHMHNYATEDFAHDLYFYGEDQSLLGVVNTATAAGGDWDGRLYLEEGSLKLRYTRPGDTNLTHVFTMADDTGSITILPDTLEHLADTEAILTTQWIEEESVIECPEGSVYVPALEQCVVISPVSSASSVASSAAASSVASSMSSAASSEQGCAQDEVYNPATGECETYVASSEASVECPEGTVYIPALNTCLAQGGDDESSSAAASSTPSSAAASSVSSETSSETIVSSAQASSSSEPVQLSETITVREGMTIARAYTIDAWILPYTFGGDERYDYLLISEQGKKYQMRGDAPNEYNIFGWKEVDVNASREDSTDYLVYLGDYDGDGDVRFDYIYVSETYDLVFLLVGATEDGTFMYEILEGVSFVREDNGITLYLEGEDLQEGSSSSESSPVSSAGESSVSSSSAGSSDGVYPN